MNYMIYTKHNTNEKRFTPMNLSDGTNRNKLFFATLIPDKNKAIEYTDKLNAECPDYSFQVREAGKAKVVYITCKGNDLPKASGEAH